MTSAAFSSEPQNHQTIRNIQLLRAAAAIGVVICHSAFLMRGSFPDLAKVMATLGFAGVDLFFVISGFVVTFVAVRASQNLQPRAALFFFTKRLLRIYPIFWIVFVASSVLELYVPALRGRMADADIVSSFFLVTARNSAVAVAWTLMFEMFFYSLVSALLFVSGRRFPPVMLVVATAFCFVLAIPNLRSHLGLGPLANPNIMDFPLVNPIMMDFCFGTFAFFCCTHLRVRAPAAVAVMGCLGLAWGCHYIMDAPWTFNEARPYVLGIPSTILLIGMVGLERKWSAGKLAVLLGDASYSIYLWHFQLIVATAWLTKQIDPWLAVCLTTGGSILVGLCSYIWVERPLLAWGSRIIEQQKPTPLYVSPT